MCQGVPETGEEKVVFGDRAAERRLMFAEVQPPQRADGEAMKILGVIETAIDVEDLDLAVSFYRRLFDFETLVLDERFCAFNVGGRSVFLLFKKGGRKDPLVVPGGVIPPHGGNGSAHFAFSITADDLPKWEERRPHTASASRGG